MLTGFNGINIVQRTLVITTLFVTKDFALKRIAVIKKFDIDSSKASIMDTFEQFYMNHTFCVFVRIASLRRFKQIHITYVFLKNNMGISMKKIHDLLIFVQTKLTL